MTMIDVNNYGEKTSKLMKKIEAYSESLQSHKSRFVETNFEINEFVKKFYNIDIEEPKFHVSPYEISYKFKFEHKNIPMIISNTFINELKIMFNMKKILITASTVKVFELNDVSGKKEWFNYPTLEVKCVYWDDKG